MASNEHNDLRGISEAALAVAFAYGDGEALSELLRRHEPRLRGAAFRMCGGNESNADDAYQELSICLINGCRTFDPNREWYLWAVMILRRCVYMLGKRRRHETGNVSLIPAVHDEVKDESSPVAIAYIGEFKAAFDECFSTVLTDEQRNIVVWKVLAGSTFAEISRILGSEDTNLASNRYYAACRLLQECLSSKGFGPLEGMK